MTAFHTWKNLAEKVHFLLEVSMRELLVSWLHKILAGVEEILWTNSINRRQNFRTNQSQERTSAYCQETDLDGIKTTVLPGKLQQRHQCLQ